MQNSGVGLLERHAVIADVVFESRPTSTGKVASVAYFVLRTVIDTAEIDAWIQSTTAASSLLWTAVSHIPLDAQGDVDFPALHACPIVNSPDVIAGWRRMIIGTGCWDSIEVTARTGPLSGLHRGLDSRSDSVAEPLRAPATNQNLAIAGSIRANLSHPRCQVLWETLTQAAEKNPNGELTFIDRGMNLRHLTYRQLAERAGVLHAGFQDRSIEAGEPVLLLFDRIADQVLAFWGCIRAGLIPTPLGSADAPKTASELEAIVSIVRRACDRYWILTTDAIRSRLKLMNYGCESRRIIALESLASSLTVDAVAPNPDATAVLVATSGSTGSPKLVQLSHDNLMSRSYSSIAMNGFRRDEISLSWMPFQHVASLVYFHLRDTLLGCRQVHVEPVLVLQDVLSWLDALEQYRVTTTFAPNFAFALVNDALRQHPERHFDLTAVRFLFNGGEQIVPRTARQFLDRARSFGLSPQAMRPAWGMSELSSGVTYGGLDSYRELDADSDFVAVGRPLPGVQLRIVDDVQTVVAEGAIGRIQVRGTTVTRGYFGDPDATRQAFTSDGWFITGDVGFITRGALTITGREKDTVVIRGSQYACQQIEAAVDRIPLVEPTCTVVISCRSAADDTDRLAVFVVPKDESRRSLDEVEQHVRRAVVNCCGVSPAHVIISQRDEIPRTPLGKTRRAELRQRFLASVGQTPLPDSADEQRFSECLPRWFHRPRWRPKRLRLDDVIAGGQTVLLFCDGSKLSRQLGQRVKNMGHRLLTAVPGSSFSRIDATRFALDPLSATDHARLLASVDAETGGVTRIASFWARTKSCSGCSSGFVEPMESDAPEFRWLSLLKGLAAQNSQGCHRSVMWVYRELPGDFRHSCFPVLCRTAMSEHPNLTCRCVQLADDEAASSAALAAELMACDGEPEVRCENGVRQVRRMVRVDVSPRSGTDALWLRRGCYLITGGLGRLGPHLADYLAREWDARLILVSRTGISQSSHAPHDSFRNCPDVVYEAVDVCDRATLKRIVDDATSRWSCGLDGAIHLAGCYAERLLVDETRASWETMMHAKVHGTRVLSDLLHERGGGKLLLFSSVSSVFGGALLGAYAAANRQAEAILEQHGFEDVQTLCVNWSRWRDKGHISNGHSAGGEGNSGYSLLDVSRAIESLSAAWDSGFRQVSIGLDDRHPRIAWMVEGPVTPQHRLEVRADGGDASLLREKLAGITVEDPFGVRTSCELQCTRQTADGSLGRRRLQRNSEPPATTVECRLAEFWGSILQVPMVSRNEAFLDLGGDSLKASRFLGAVEAGFGVSLSLGELLGPDGTIRHIARLIEDRLLTEIEAQDVVRCDAVAPSNDCGK